MTPCDPHPHWHDACDLASLRESSIHPCVDAGLPVILVRLGGTVHALDAVCTHGDADLADGEVTGCEIECPFHGGRFDIATGAAVALPCTEPLKTYAVRIVAGRVEVAAPSVFDVKESP